MNTSRRSLLPVRARRAVWWHLIFSHHFADGPEGWSRCWCLPLGARRMLPLCARCFAIYPLAAVLLALGLLGRVSLAWLDGWGVWLLPLPVWLEAVTDWMGWRRGNNFTRMITGLLLAPALARLFERYLLDPWDGGVWQVVVVYGFSAVCAAVLGRMRNVEATPPG